MSTQCVCLVWCSAICCSCAWLCVLAFCWNGLHAHFIADLNLFTKCLHLLFAFSSCWHPSTHSLASSSFCAIILQSLTHSSNLSPIFLIPQEFVSIAATLAQNADRLRSIRANLRQWMLSSPLCDGHTHTAHVEEAYRTIWRKWCAQTRPR